MTLRSISVCLLILGVMTALAVYGLAQNSPTEAPAGFDTPTVVENPGSLSKSYGIV